MARGLVYKPITIIRTASQFIVCVAEIDLSQ